MQLASFIRLLRPHQWSKNLLIFVSIFAGHQLADAVLLSRTTLAFVAFCLAASGGYVLNDLADRHDDRAHPRKRLRPLAAGEIKPAAAAVLAAMLLAAAIALAAVVSRELLACVAAYLAASQTYTFYAKRKLALDIIFLAGLYDVRIIAGAVVTGAVPSFWLLAFFMFLFFSLAALKRFVELAARDDEDLDNNSTRVYRSADRAGIAALGSACGVVSVLVFALYLNSREVAHLYTNPALLWLACPLLLYWIARAWLLAARGLVQDDPVTFALRDRVSYVLLCLFGLIAAAAT